MPLLRKQPFHRQKIPHDLQPEEEVFHCKITNEIFRDYNAFFERIILCNSLVWSCAITGRSGMTFQEAEECEEKAKRNLANFQDSLKRPLLFLATLTHRSRLNDLNDDIFIFAKDRYFIGETLECLQGSERISCKVVGVERQVEEKTNGDIIVIEDSDEDSNLEGKSEKKKKASSQDYSKYSYMVKLSGQVTATTVSPDKLSRKRGLYSRDRSKLFLKQHCEPVNGLWKVKQSTMKKLGLLNATFEDFFSGPPPSFEVSQIKRKNNAKRSFEPSSSYIEFEEPPTRPPKVPKSSKHQKELQGQQDPLPSQLDRALMKERLKQEKMEAKEAKKEEMRRQIEAEKIRRKEEREKERLKKMEEKRREIEMFREWSRPREDLECDDLKDMPEFIPVRTRIPPDIFGDAVMILEFTHIFKSIFDFKQFFPKGFTWVMMESALMDHEPDGPLCDLLQMLLCALFNLQEEEAEEYEELEKEENVKPTEDKEEDMEEEVSTNELMRSATLMAQFSQNTFGMPLRDTLLDQFTLSEILRIHLLASGARASAKNARFRYQQRGGYTAQDDPGLELKMECPSVVKALLNMNVFDLTPANKVKLIDTLVQQIITYAMVRDMIDESSEKLRLKKYDLKQFQWAEQRREKEEQANKYKKMMEERAREQAKRMQQLMAEQNGLSADLPPLPDIVEKSPEEKEVEKKKEHEMETRKKADFCKKECEMLEEIMDLQRMVSVYPVGRDRLYRRYYYFSGLNGIFIEDHELHVPPELLNSSTNAGSTGTKLKLLPQLTFQGEGKENGRAKANGDDCIVISDEENGEDSKVKKENEIKTEVQNSDDGTQIKTEDKNPESDIVGEVQKSSDSGLDSVKTEGVQVEENCIPERNDSPPVLESQSSVPETHNPTWTFIDTPELLDALVECLNVRGFRESALRTALLELKPLLVKSLRDCPTDMLSLPEDGGEEKARIQALALTRGISSKKAAQDALMKEKAEATMELNLRDAILDMEDRIHVGSLGSLKIKDRASWRGAILKRHYDSQCDDPALSSNRHVNGDVDSHVSSDSQPVARDLGKALVQIARGVEPRFLREPLGGDEATRKKLSAKKRKEEGEENDAEESSSGTKKSLHERWEESLLSATSLSQVYLHLATLDKSIIWARSTLETRCRLCRRKGDAEKMLLCDGCDRGHHMYCLKPPMEKVPTGDWFCPDCRPKQVPRSPVRKGRRKTFTEEEENEEEELESQDEEETEEEQEDVSMEDEEEENEDEDATEEEEEEDEETENEEENEDEEDDEDEMELGENPEEDLCSACKTGGTLICCDCCPRAYHLTCAKPALKKIPKGKWMCQVCIGIDRTGKIKIGTSNKNGKSKTKTNELSKGKEKDKERRSAGKSTPLNSRPGSRRESPRDSPVFGARPKKNTISTLAIENLGESGMRKSRSTSKLPAESSNDKSPIIRLMKPINPSSKRVNSQQQQLKAAEELINELIKHEDAWPFLKPVDKKLVPDYYDVIKEPMDFGTIRNKIHAFSYQKPSEMLADVRKIFKNCVEYNNRSSPEYKASCRLSKFFDKRIKEKNLSEDLPSPSKNNRGRVSV